MPQKVEFFPKRIIKSALKIAGDKAAQLKSQITVLYYVGQSRELPRLTRFLIVFTIAYALSPVDLIPDFIPVLGYLDDLIILPLLITLCIRSVPEQIMTEAKEKAEKNPVSLGKSRTAGVIIVFLWLGLLSLILYKVIIKIH